MAGQEAETSSRSWRDVGRLAVAGTAAAIGVSLIVAYLLLFNEALTAFARSMVLAVVLPLLITTPLLVFIGLRLQETRRQRQALNRLATYDQATGLMTGKALANVVERRVNARDVEDPARGGFLVVRLDNLLDINVEYGFDSGNEALRLVAFAIRGSVRDSDTVGRLGPGEFGVFLPGASEENAREVGERIRADIAKIAFTPASARVELEISTGGVIFEQDFAFGDMFRTAEGQLASGNSRDGLALTRAAERRTGTSH